MNSIPYRRVIPRGFKILSSAAFLAVFVMFFCVDLQSMPVVENGQARAVVVTAEEPSEVASYAADELRKHLEKATGVLLPAASETEDLSGYPTRIYVGETEAARRAGMEIEELGPDAFILSSFNGDVYVLGKEDIRPPSRDRHTSDQAVLGEGDDAPPAPLSERNSYSGTLFGVYELLERYVGVRWLWPGELGTFVPHADTITIGEIDEKNEPALRFRRYRWSRLHRSFRNEEVKRLSFSDDGFWNYREDLRVYARRHRMGYTEVKPTIGHRFGSFWERYGEDHPEWFMMHEDGRRAVPADESRFQRFGVPMCVSNPDLHRYIVEETQDGGFWPGRGLIRLGEVDVWDYCHCEECLSWDAPQPQPETARDRITSDRYARFWKTVHEMAAERDPDAVVSTFLYMGYFPAPLEDIELNENIYGEFVPWGGGNTIWYPADKERLEWQREQWHGWAETGITMGYRPNHTLAGYAMPHINTRQGGEFMRFAYKHGMIGADFDSLIGQWAVRGPEHYMYFRLIADPARSVEQIRDEYFSAFGPAAEHVEKYFDYWEDYNHKLMEREEWHNMWRYPQHAPWQYPPEVFPPARHILEKALEAAREHSRSEFAERVEFLKAGLEHARLSVDFVRKLGPGGSYPDDREGFLKARDALDRLIQFRREHEALYIADFVWLARLENAELDINTILETEIDDLDLAETAGVSPWEEWYFRRDPDNVGVEEGWYELDAADDEEWIPVEVPAFLSSTQVGEYHGYGWYSTTFTVPEDWEDRDVILLFGAVDEQAWVYVNGRYVGEHTEKSEQVSIGDLWDQPFSIDVDARHIKPGRDNVLVVRMHASTGEAGIWHPVRIRPIEDHHDAEEWEEWAPVGP